MRRGKDVDWRIGGEWGMGGGNLEGGDLAPDDFVKDTSCGGHFTGGLGVVVMFYSCDRRLISLMVGLLCRSGGGAGW